jgi:hypothetical protein
MSAARQLSRSLVVRPALDKRTALLLGCALPVKVRETLNKVRRAVV